MRSKALETWWTISLVLVRNAILFVSVFQDSMLIYGGMTENGTEDSLWSFNITSLRWSKVCTNVKCVLNVQWSHDWNKLHFCRALSWSETFLVESRTCLVAEKSSSVLWFSVMCWSFHLVLEPSCYLRFKYWNSSMALESCTTSQRDYPKRPSLYLSCITIGLVLDCV